MLEFATASQNLPFAIVLGLLVTILVIELFGLMFGAEVGGLLGELDLPDLDMPDLDMPDLPVGANVGFLTSFLYWLNVGRVPVIILIVLFMTAFVITGYMLQLAVLSFAGFLLPGYLASLAALAASVPVVKVVGKTVGRIVPRDETEAISQSELVGSRALITIGKAKAGYPAQARVCDRYGTNHYLMLEPDNPDEVLETGVDLLLVRYDGSKYYAIRHPEP